MTYKNYPVFGVIQCSVLCPRNLNRPFLAAKSGDKTYYCCCLLCNGTKRRGACVHTDEERYFFTTCCTAELCYSLSLGYKIGHIFEAICYKDRAPIFSSYLKILLAGKSKHSPVPSTVDSETYCKEINRSLNLCERLKLCSTSLLPNPGLRSLYKNLINTLPGKWSQNNDDCQTLYLTTQEELTDLYYQSTKVLEDIHCYNNICQATVRSKKRTVNRSCNTIIAAYTLAYGRICLDQRVKYIESLGGCSHYIDSDCVCYHLPKTISIYENYPFVPGNWHSEIGEGLEAVQFILLGVKNYMVLCRNKSNGSLSLIIRCKGFTIGREEKHIFTAELYQQYLDDYLNKVVNCTAVRQVRKMKYYQYCNGMKRIVYGYISTMHLFSNEIRERRIIQKNTLNCITWPFGHSNKKN